MSSFQNIFSYCNNFDKIAGIKSHLVIGDKFRKPVFYSILIPTFNRPKLVKDAIDSAINQNGFSNYEIIIVDNDPFSENISETQKLIETYNNPFIFYYKHDINIGMFSNWNRAVELANGKWVTFLHDDDYFLPDLLNSVHSVLSSNNIIKGIKAGQQTFFQNDKVELVDFVKNSDFSSKNTNYWKLRKSDNFFRNTLQCPSGIFFLKEEILKLGGFNPDFFPAADYLFTTNYLLNYNMYQLNGKYWIYRVFQNEALNQKTKEKIIEQNFQIRYLVGLMLGKNKWFLKPFVSTIILEEVDAIIKDGKEINNVFLRRLLKLNIKFRWIYTKLLRFMYLEQRIYIKFNSRKNN
jgi:glycosyltransferase involved in cell wall biosynthesis